MDQPLNSINEWMIGTKAAAVVFTYGLVVGAQLVVLVLSWWRVWVSRYDKPPGRPRQRPASLADLSELLKRPAPTWTHSEFKKRRQTNTTPPGTPRPPETPKWAGPTYRPLDDENVDPSEGGTKT